MKQKILQTVFAALVCAGANAQVNSGSNGSDGAFNPAANIVINMANHPDGIYQYTSVNISNNVTVTFIPNAANTPVTWLIQSNCVISGSIDLSGSRGSFGSAGGQGGSGGPGGGAGGHAGSSIDDAGSGFGPGGGQGAIHNANLGGGSGGYGTAVVQPNTNRVGGSAYGNIFLLPLIGGSGGGGGYWTSSSGGSGGGGAICIAVSGTLNLSGTIYSFGGQNSGYEGAGSGGAIRLVASTIMGQGSINTYSSGGGNGRVRIDATVNNFAGNISSATYTQGYQPIILPAGQQPYLSIVSVAGLPAPSNPTGSAATPDVSIAGQVANPMPVVVQCSNLALNTTITLRISPQTAPEIYATAVNSSGTQASSTATFSVNMPHGGGLMYAQCVAGITNGFSSNASGSKYQSLAQTGWSATGEQFVAMELTAEFGKAQKVVYITESGKRFPMSSM
jgi:hypothetical protein